MLLTATLFAKKVKSKHILVSVQSLVSGHKLNCVRERLGDKMEFIRFDPHGYSLFTLANHVASNVLGNSNKKNISDYGFGKAYMWRNLIGGFEEAKKVGKPVFLLIHKTTCPACQKLKDKFSVSIKLIDLSNHFIMINVENSLEAIKNGQYAPDGKYVPRILFFNSNGEFISNAYNRHPDADPEHKFFYSSPAQIIDVMQQVIDNNKRSSHLENN